MFTTFNDLRLELKKIGTPEMNFQKFIETRDYCLNNPDSVKAMLNVYKVAELKQMCFSPYATKKEQFVKSIYDTVLGYFHLGDSISYMPMSGETYEQALKKQFEATTEAMYIKYCEEQEAKMAVHKKALSNPETIDEFRTFIRYKGEGALSSDQRAAYDTLITDQKKRIAAKEEERKAEVKKVENVNTAMEIKESFHAKKQIPLWVVTLGDRVDRSVYDELNARAKKLGGYYSSYRGNGAIPGFTFEDKDAAELFVQVKDGNVNASEIKKEQKEERQLTKAEAMTQRANKIIEEATEELNRDRQSNTARRARFAASAEQAATKKIEFGKTLLKIAEMMAENKIKYLDKLTTNTELDELQSILTQAKYRHIRKANLRSDEYEIGMETVEHVEIPFPTLYKSNVLGLLDKLKNDAGKKLAAARLIKSLEKTKEDFLVLQGTSILEDYETVFCYMSPSISTWEVKSFKERLLRYKRIERLEATSLPELRTMLRELLTIKQGVGLTAEQKRALELKELERKFIGTKIEGFFPTSDELAEEIIDKAGIEEGDRICEPNGGLGHIADKIAVQFSDNELKVYEINHSLAQALITKGHDAEQMDFLQVTEKFDKIVMNPPFEDLQDIDHLMHAYSLLNEGGRVVCIMADNKNGERRKTVEFNEWLEKVGGTVEQNEKGAFLEAFRPTAVSTITVVIDK